MTEQLNSVLQCVATARELQKAQEENNPAHEWWLQVYDGKGSKGGDK